MASFNSNSRTSNSIKTSVIGVSSFAVKVLLGFIYRSLFLMILSSTYLGLNGLFTNILQILSLAEFGITTAITYRFYEPISKNDILYVGKLMNFFRRVYLVIAGVILIIGLALMPLIHLLIRDASEIPSDVNLYLVYCLFLANTISTYLFTYKLTLLTADQKHYITSLIDLILTVVKYGSQVLLLLLTHNYSLTLAVGIGVTLLVNFIFSLWVTKKYKEVFSVKETLSKDERKQIYRDTRASMYHKIGTTVLVGTDNAVLTRMVSLAATGLYSNYSMLLTYIQSFFTQLVGNFTSSVGNALQKMEKDEYYALYKKMQFVCLWFASVVVVVCYLVIDDFIFVWLGKDYVFNNSITIVLCVQLYISISRTINVAFINADGLFVKDKIRPLIEACLNLGISIFLTWKMGIVGVFLGTIISALLTVFWREPLILYRHSFQRNIIDYWKTYGIFVLITGFYIAALALIKTYLITIPVSWIYVICEVLISFLLINAGLLLLFHKKSEYQFLRSVIRRMLSKIPVINKKLKGE